MAGGVAGHAAALGVGAILGLTSLSGPVGVGVLVTSKVIGAIIGHTAQESMKRRYLSRVTGCKNIKDKIELYECAIKAYEKIRSDLASDSKMCEKAETGVRKNQCRAKFTKAMQKVDKKLIKLNQELHAWKEYHKRK